MYSRNHVATECFTFLIVLLKFHKQWPYNAGVVLAKVYNAAAVVYLFLFTLCFIVFIYRSRPILQHTGLR